MGLPGPRSGFIRSTRDRFLPVRHGLLVAPTNCVTVLDAGRAHRGPCRGLAIASPMLYLKDVHASFATRARRRW